MQILIFIPAQFVERAVFLFSRQTAPFLGLLPFAFTAKRHTMLKKTPQERYDAREARIARWQRPITNRRERLDAWLNMIFVDHGFFRFFYLNKHSVDGKLYRAAQPWPHHIKAFARQGGKSLVYLRGGFEHGSWPLEKEVAEKSGLSLHEFIARSREAPSKEQLLEAPAFFAGLNYPTLIHCKSGADRAGFVAALYVLVHLKRTADEAMEQLSPRFGHFRMSKTGILDRFFEMYRDEAENKGIPYVEWVEQYYDPKKLQATVKTGFWSNFLVDRILHRE
jgi:protein tyrosine/serine phosphatase